MAEENGTPSGEPEGEPSNTLLTGEGTGTPEGGKVEPSDGQGTDPTGDGKSGDGEPEWGADTLKAPEGYEVLEANSVEDLVKHAKEMGLNKEQAQNMLDFQSQSIMKVVDSHNENWDNTMNEWVETTRQDKDIGGPKLEESLTDARKTLNTFGNNALAALVDQTGLGNHPEFIRFMSKVGKAIKEDRFVFGEQSPSAPTKTAAQIMYPTMEN